MRTSTNAASHEDGRQALTTAASLVPANPNLSSLADAARHCQACDLYLRAKQTVFGEGNRRARVILVGEQPEAMCC